MDNKLKVKSNLYSTERDIFKKNILNFETNESHFTCTAKFSENQFE